MKNKLIRKFVEELRDAYHGTKHGLTDVYISELEPINFRECVVDELRINLLVPSIDRRYVFAGIATGIDFFREMVKLSRSKSRIIVTDDSMANPEMIVDLQDYKLFEPDQNENFPKQIVPFANRRGKTLPVGKKDIFIATAWWTAYNIKAVTNWQKKQYGVINKIIYLIQDFEPGFYPWSSRYLLAESTYKDRAPKIAVFNSKSLYDYFIANNIRFDLSYYFEPVLNKTLQDFLHNGIVLKKEKKIILYGRPSVARNAFELIVAGVKKWAFSVKNPKEWEILSLGENHQDIAFANGVVIRSCGKLTLEEYADMLKRAYAGISLMVSPHPSYPPLEMAAFGVKVITNKFANKDLGIFSDNIISIDCCDGDTIAEELKKNTDTFVEDIPGKYMPGQYTKGNDTFEEICNSIMKRKKISDDVFDD
jgi:hypothetical protein